MFKCEGYNIYEQKISVSSKHGAESQRVRVGFEQMRKSQTCHCPKFGNSQGSERGGYVDIFIITYYFKLHSMILFLVIFLWFSSAEQTFPKVSEENLANGKPRNRANENTLQNTNCSSQIQFLTLSHPIQNDESKSHLVTQKYLNVVILACCGFVSKAQKISRISL